MKLLKEYLLWYGLGGLMLAVVLIQLAWPRYFATSLRIPDFGVFSVKCDLIFLTPIASWYALKSMKTDQQEKSVAWGISLFAAGFCEVTHYWIADRGHLFAGASDNTSWQLWVQQGVLARSADFIPHSYRFLPNCIVALFQWLCGSFEFARTAYRLLFNALLFAMIFRYARFYLSAVAAVAVQMIILLLYPLTILQYAGQLTDPASHLSFVVCLYCLATGYEPGFGPGLILGIFAKESVIVMALCRLFYGFNRRRAVALTLAYLLAGMATIILIRRFVLRGAIHYQNISGVDLSHILINLRSYQLWAPTYLVSLVALIPGAVLGWKLVAPSFRVTCVLITVAAFISSVIFSWLGEVRNLLPAFIPLAIINVKYFETVLNPRVRQREPQVQTLEPAAASLAFSDLSEH